MPLSSDKRSVWQNERRAKHWSSGAHGIIVGRRILSVRSVSRGLAEKAVRRSVEGRHTVLIFVGQVMQREAMASELFFIFRRPLDPDRRLAMALLASALLHALMLSSGSRYSVHGNFFTRPVVAPLSVRIERLPESPDATPIVLNDKNASLHLKLSAPKPVATTGPADIEPSFSQPGVSVSDILYLQPISARVRSSLLATGEFRRTADISEKPEVVAMRVPPYPRPAREQKLSGWVIVLLFVDAEGKVVDTAAVESSESFNDYESDVAEALRGSTFMPGKLDGRAVKTLMFARVSFDSKTLSGLEAAKGSAAPVSIENKEKR